jgi:uncharacterized membrane protein HdeD (DUF308 family)
MRINYSFIRSVFALVIGLVLTCVPDKSAEYIVMTIGILFIASGAIALISYYASKNAKQRLETVETEQETKVVQRSSRFPIEALGSMILGIWFICTPTLFISILMIVLSVILIIGGLQQIIMLIRANKWKKTAFGYYIVPSLIFLAGIYTLWNPNEVGSAILMVIGIACIVYAAYELFNWFMFLRYKPRVEILEDKEQGQEEKDKSEEKE